MTRFIMTSHSMRRGWPPILVFLILTLLVLSGCNSRMASQEAIETNTVPITQPDANNSTEEQIDSTEQTVPIEPIVAPDPLPEPTSLTLLAVGDIMMHSPQFPAYLDQNTGLYNFNSYFSAVKPIIESADLAWGNLETPLLGGEKIYTGYPMFNAPAELADALKWAGFDIMTNANNHSLDRRERGIIKTLEVLRERELVTRGTYLSKWESMQPTIVEKNNIKLGILSYTYGTNGIPLPKDKPYMVDLMDKEKMLEDIKLTKQAGADVVAIALHFGNEYEPKPNEVQKELARTLAAGGADIILGSHPHVLQPYERIQVTDSEGNQKDALIMYSLGNFISNQRGDNKDIGCMLTITIHKDANGHIQLQEETVQPTWVNRTASKGQYKYEVIPLETELAKQTDLRFDEAQRNKLKSMLAKADNHLRSMTEVQVVQALP